MLSQGQVNRPTGGRNEFGMDRRQKARDVRRFLNFFRGATAGYLISTLFVGGEYSFKEAVVPLLILLVLSYLWRNILGLILAFIFAMVGEFIRVTSYIGAGYSVVGASFGIMIHIAITLMAVICGLALGTFITLSVRQTKPQLDLKLARMPGMIYLAPVIGVFTILASLSFELHEESLMRAKTRIRNERLPDTTGYSVPVLPK